MFLACKHCDIEDIRCGKSEPAATLQLSAATIVHDPSTLYLFMRCMGCLHVTHWLVYYRFLCSRDTISGGTFVIERGNAVRLESMH